MFSIFCGNWTCAHWMWKMLAPLLVYIRLSSNWGMGSHILCGSLSCLWWSLSRFLTLLVLLYRFFALKYSADAACTVLRVDQVWLQAYVLNSFWCLRFIGAHGNIWINMNCSDHHGQAGRRSKKRCPAWWWDGRGLVLIVIVFFVSRMRGFRAENILSYLGFGSVEGFGCLEFTFGRVAQPCWYRMGNLHVLSWCIAVLMYQMINSRVCSFSSSHQLSSCKEC